MSPLIEEMPGRAEELSTLFEKRNRRGEHRSPETPPSSLRLATSSKEEALPLSPLIEEMPGRAEEF